MSRALGRGERVQIARGWKAVLALCTLFLVHCGSWVEPPSHPRPPKTSQPDLHIVTVTVAGAVRAGVTIFLSGPDLSTRTLLTDETGFASIELPKGTYTVTPRLSGYSFSPTEETLVVERGGSGTGFAAIAVPSPCDHFAPPAPGSPKRFTITPFTPSLVPGGTAGAAEASSGSTDGSGALALQAISKRGESHFFFVWRDGTAMPIQDQHAPDVTLLGQLYGFEGVSRDESGWGVVFYGQNGLSNEVSDGHGSGHPLVANDPTGGLMVFDPTLRAFIPFTDRGQRREQIPLGVEGTLEAFGVDRRGAVLALFDGASSWGQGSIGGIWLTQSHTRTQAFLVSHSGGRLALATQVDGGFFLQIDGTWTSSVASESTAVLPAPEWLATRPRARLHMAHGGKAYAVLPAPSGCTIEVVSSQGETCGEATFGTEPCNDLEVGYEGTVLTPRSVNPAQDCDDDGFCVLSWMWWPQFFG